MTESARSLGALFSILSIGVAKLFSHESGSISKLFSRGEARLSSQASDFESLLAKSERLNAKTSQISRNVIQLVRGEELDQNLPQIEATDLGQPSANSSLPQAVDLRGYDSPVRDQKDRGTCTAFALAAVIEQQAFKHTGRNIDLSEESLWSLYASPSMTSAVAAIQRHPFTNEKNWPYGATKPMFKDSGWFSINSGARFSKVQSIDEIIHSLAAGEGVFLSFRTSTDIANVRGKRLVPEPSESIAGAHAVALSGYVLDLKIPGGGYFIFKNSWGNEWGDKGYGYLPFAACKMNKCSGIRVANAGVVEAEVKGAQSEH